jgi:AbrB family looped-hinge helix DNA binding protein
MPWRNIGREPPSRCARGSRGEIEILRSRRQYEILPWKTSTDAEPLVTSRLGTKSQTVVPKQVREALGVASGDQVGFTIRNGRVILMAIRRMAARDDPFACFDEGADTKGDASLSSRPRFPMSSARSDNAARRSRSLRSGRLAWSPLGLMIPAAANPRRPDDVEIDDHDSAGLPIARVVRTTRFATIEARTAGSSEEFKGQLLLELHV